MTRSLAFRLTLAFLLVSLAGIALVAVFTGRVTESEFGHFMMRQSQSSLTDALADHYRLYGSWEGAETVISHGPPGMGMGNGPMMGSEFALADASGEIVAAGGGHHRGEHLSPTVLAHGLAIEVNRQIVGTLLPVGNNSIISAAGTEFLARVNRALLFAALGAGIISVVLGALLARALTKPIGELTHATRAIATGGLGQQVEVRSKDELGELAAAFNHMSADLARARDQRRQMTADIAHDLRTPLSVILGHAEALRDGVLPPTPETLALVHDEALRLNRLVEDLRTLSLVEAGELSLNRRRIAPGALLERAVAAQTPRALQNNIALQIQIDPALPEIDADPDRLAQVLGNLLDNALRHTPVGGKVTCRVTGDNPHSASRVTFSITDTGPGIAPEDLPHIFDRFYRADKARARSTEQGGSGLGLAIAKSMVEAHGGKIRAENASGSGAQFIIELPTAG